MRSLAVQHSWLRCRSLKSTTSFAKWSQHRCSPCPSAARLSGHICQRLVLRSWQWYRRDCEHTHRSILKVAGTSFLDFQLSSSVSLVSAVQLHSSPWSLKLVKERRDSRRVRSRRGLWSVPQMTTGLWGSGQSWNSHRFLYRNRLPAVVRGTCRLTLKRWNLGLERLARLRRLNFVNLAMMLSQLCKLKTLTKHNTESTSSGYFASLFRVLARFLARLYSSLAQSETDRHLRHW